MNFIGTSKPQEQKVSKLYMTGDLVSPVDQFRTKKAFRLITFLRHPGCPFAEESVKNLRKISDKYSDVDFFIITHGDEKICRTWFHKIGGINNINIIHDENRSLYGSFGLGYTGIRHFLGLSSLFGVVKLLFKGIRNRNESGTRWQKSGTFLLNREGRVLWTHVPNSAEENPNLNEALNQFAK